MGPNQDKPGQNRTLNQDIDQDTAMNGNTRGINRIYAVGVTLVPEMSLWGKGNENRKQFCRGAAPPRQNPWPWSVCPPAGGTAKANEGEL